MRKHEYINGRLFEVRETKMYKRIYLVDTDRVVVTIVYSKEDHDMDRVRTCKLANYENGGQPEEVVVYRYEDHAYIELIEKMYNLI